jgi:hypothetical protein
MQIVTTKTSSLNFSSDLSGSDCGNSIHSISRTKMKQRTWPGRSDGSRFLALSLSKIKGLKSKEEAKMPNRKPPSSSRPIRFTSRWSSPSPSSSDNHDFSGLPYDVLTKIAASFSLQNLRAASLVCKAWSEALKPLREAMLFLRWGKRFKHGYGGVRKNLDKALDSFLKGAARGSALAMVDAGLIYWELGHKDKAIALYHKAAELGDPAGQCNLAISFLNGTLFLNAIALLCLNL